MIGITGVTGKLGSRPDLVDKRNCFYPSGKKSRAATVYASAEIRKMVYANTPEGKLEALAYRCLIDGGLCSGKPERVEEHRVFLDAAKLAGAAYRLYLLLLGR